MVIKHIDICCKVFIKKYSINKPIDDLIFECSTDWDVGRPGFGPTSPGKGELQIKQNQQ